MNCFAGMTVAAAPLSTPTVMVRLVAPVNGLTAISPTDINCTRSSKLVRNKASIAESRSTDLSSAFCVSAVWPSRESTLRQSRAKWPSLPHLKHLIAFESVLPPPPLPLPFLLSCCPFPEPLGAVPFFTANRQSFFTWPARPQ